MSLTILQSVERQLKDKHVLMNGLLIMKKNYVKNAGETRSINRKIFELKGMINQITESLNMMKDGYMYTKQGWILK